MTVGGLSFASIHGYETDTELSLRFPTLDPQFVAWVRVAWCETVVKGYRIGVTFFDAQDAFRLRMLEQIAAIEAHRRHARVEGEKGQTANDAAFEWIRDNGGGFPNP